MTKVTTWNSHPTTPSQHLWIHFKETGDLGDRERLILHYSPLVKYVAGRVGSGLPPTVENADLVSYGLFGLIDAIQKFDLERKLKFETYALSRIRGAIIDELRGLDWVPRSIRARSRAIERAYAELEGELHRVPSDLEVADRLASMSMRCERCSRRCRSPTWPRSMSCCMQMKVARHWATPWLTTGSRSPRRCSTCPKPATSLRPS